MEAAVEASGICPEQCDAKPWEPWWSQAIPTRLWHVVGIETSPATRDYVTIVDYYSRFLSLISCPFQTRGVAETEVGDNRPCYNLSEFHCLAKSSGFTYPKTSPHYPPEQRSYWEVCPESQERTGQSQKLKTNPFIQPAWVSKHTSRQREVTCTTWQRRWLHSRGHPAAGAWRQQHISSSPWTCYPSRPDVLKPNDLHPG